MRSVNTVPVAAIAAVLAMLVISHGPGPATASDGTRGAATKCENKTAIGVSRTVELDATRTHLGEQYHTHGFDPLKDGEVVLTFDDGPLRAHTKAVLAALREHCTKATFFTVGQMAISDPDMLREVAADGHTIGHHTWSHKNQKTRNLQNAIAEFELGVSAVQLVIGKPSAPFFRFPYLSDPQIMQRYANQRGFGIFSIDVDSFDWRSRSAPRVHAQIMAQLKSKRKGIILFHDIQAATAKALEGLLDDMHAHGFKVVHLVAKEGAKSLPEYDAEARTLLDKRAWNTAARPLKTEFKFDAAPKVLSDATPAEETTTPGAVVAKVSATADATTGALVDKPEPAPTSAPTSVRPPQSPDWRRKVFGIGD